MSRHRNVRSLNYEEECDGYDDVYGHSVEDDFCVSPSTAAEFMYDRSQQQQHVLSNFMKKEHEPNIPEEEAENCISGEPIQDTSSYKKPILDDVQEARLYSCLEELRSILGDSTPDQILIDAIMKADFDHEKALNAILNQQETPKPQREPRKRRDRDDCDSLSRVPPPVCTSVCRVIGYHVSRCVESEHRCLLVALSRSHHTPAISQKVQYKDPDSGIAAVDEFKCPSCGIHFQIHHQMIHPPFECSVSFACTHDHPQTPSMRMEKISENDCVLLLSQICLFPVQLASQDKSREDSFSSSKTDLFSSVAANENSPPSHPPGSVLPSGSPSKTVDLSQLAATNGIISPQTNSSLLPQLAATGSNPPKMLSSSAAKEKTGSGSTRKPISLSSLAAEFSSSAGSDKSQTAFCFSVNNPTTAGSAPKQVDLDSLAATKSTAPLTDCPGSSSLSKRTHSLPAHRTSPPKHISLSQLAAQTASPQNSLSKPSHASHLAAQDKTSTKLECAPRSFSLSHLAAKQQTPPGLASSQRAANLSQIAVHLVDEARKNCLSSTDNCSSTAANNGTLQSSQKSTDSAAEGSKSENGSPRAVQEAVPPKLGSLWRPTNKEGTTLNSLQTSQRAVDSGFSSKFSFQSQHTSLEDDGTPSSSTSPLTAELKEDIDEVDSMIPTAGFDNLASLSSKKLAFGCGTIKAPPGFTPKAQPLGMLSLSDLAAQHTHKAIPPKVSSLSNLANKKNPEVQDTGLGSLKTSNLSEMAPDFDFSSNPRSRMQSTSLEDDGTLSSSTSPPTAELKKGFDEVDSTIPTAGFDNLASLSSKKLAFGCGTIKAPPGFTPKAQPLGMLSLSDLAAQHKVYVTKPKKEKVQVCVSTEVSVHMARPSLFAQTLCMKYTGSENKAAVASCGKLAGQKCAQKAKLDITPFDFSTPSPDDIVKKKQQAAFGRSSYRARVPADKDKEPNQATKPVIKLAEPVPRVSPSTIQDTTHGVARMTFSASKPTKMGFDAPEQTDEKITETKDKPEKVTVKEKPADNMVVDGATNAASDTPKKDAADAKMTTRSKQEKQQLKAMYDKRKSENKAHLNLVVIGHVDAGKSTLMGHVLYQLGFVNKKVMHKHEQEAKKMGKASFAYAWVLDETEEERSRGVTMDIAQTKFETDSKMITLLDAPGHKDFIPNMITGAGQADVAILVVNATTGEFETGFDMGGQTREHAMLIRSLGVSQLLVAVNKMDTVDWSEARYNEIVKKLGSFLKQAGFKEADVSYVPCSGLIGENLTKPSKIPELSKWYHGPCVVQQIDQFRPPARPIDKPFRLSVTDVFKGQGAGFSVAGTIQAGCIQSAEKVLVMPQAELATVKSVVVDDAPTQIAFAGDTVILTLVGIEMTNIGIGSIICDRNEPIRASTRFQARVVIFNIDIPITKGFPVEIHYQSLTEPGQIRQLVSQLHKSTGEVIKKKPRCLVKNSNAVVEIEVERPICLELYREYKNLGRIMLRSGGHTIAAGLVTEIITVKKTN